MSGKRLYLIDATAFCYRAFYALGNLSTSRGEPTNAVFGFTAMLTKLLKEKQPEFLGVCFDVSRETFRRERFPDYKLNRPPAPEGLIGQIPAIKEIIRAYGLTIFEKEGFEADDIIAVLARSASAQGFFVTIISSDKDMLQLVNKKTQVFSPHKDEGTTYDEEKVRERFGVAPPRIPEMIALMGDDVDNIPGTPGIGEKTAASLLQEFGSLDELLSHVDRLKSEKLKSALKEHEKRIRLNWDLARLDNNLELEFNVDQTKVHAPDHKELFSLFKRLEFKKLLKTLPSEEQSGTGVSLRHYADAELPLLSAGATEMVVHVEEGRLFFACGGARGECDPAGSVARSLLGNAAVRKIGHDLKKAKVAFARQGIALEGLQFDVMLAAYVLNPSRPEYTLSDIAWEYAPEVHAVSPSPSRILEMIASLVPRLNEELVRKSLLDLFHRVEMPLIEVLAAMELSGIRIDSDFLKGLSRKMEERLSGRIAEIYRMSGVEFNINSPKQLREILFDRLRLPVVKRTKTGPSTDEEVLRRLSEKHPLPDALLDYRQLMKLKSTYVDALPLLVNQETQRIHSSFNQTATETGRLSSTNPNLQNIPIKTELGSQIRKGIIAFTEGSVLLSCDYSQIELRVLAHLSKDEALCEAFRQNKDIHRATATLIYGIAETEVTDQMREAAKRINFGIVYGLTAFGLSKDLHIPIEEAQAFIDAYFSRYPGVRVYIDGQIKQARVDGFVTTIMGRRRYLADINNRGQALKLFAERQAVNTPIQGSASDLIKLAMIQIYRTMRQRPYSAAMILQVHDELVFDVPGSEFDAFSKEVKHSMENVLTLEVPVRVSMKKGHNWLEMEEVPCISA